MTRETKISLLVGLAFIIVIGILLSDHFRATQELPPAVLSQVGSTARRATDGPEAANPGISFVSPSDTTPKQAVPTHDELITPPSPVIPSPNYGNRAAGNQTANGNSNTAAIPEDHGADAPENPLNDIAQRNGEPVEPANVDGSSRAGDANAPAPVAAAPRQYRAEDGDTVSRMAAKFLGENTRDNRQAIIDANPSLQQDPDRVIVGKSYVIPAPGGSPSASNAVIPNNSNESASSAYFYTVKEGDSLWQIANDQLDDPSAVDAIKDLNTSILKGEQHDVVIPGMKLRLPAKPVAETNTN
jgi:nucleoid-associated protein YgaU